MFPPEQVCVELTSSRTSYSTIATCSSINKQQKHCQGYALALPIWKARAEPYQSQVHSLGSARKQPWGWLEAAVLATHFTALAIPVTVLWRLVHVCRGGRESIAPPHGVDSALEPLTSRSRVWLCSDDSNCVYAASTYLLSSHWLQNQGTCTKWIAQYRSHTELLSLHSFATNIWINMIIIFIHYYLERKKYIRNVCYIK